MTKPNEPRAIERNRLEYWQLKNEHGDILRVESVGSAEDILYKIIQVIEFKHYQKLERELAEVKDKTSDGLLVGAEVLIENQTLRALVGKFRKSFMLIRQTKCNSEEDCPCCEAGRMLIETDKVLGGRP